LVLSACRTAVGDDAAELGFAGFAIAAGVKSALASLWYVSDVGTLTLMTQFYHYLSETDIKAEALRQAQLALIHNEFELLDTGEIYFPNLDRSFPLPPETSANEIQNLAHPYYWSAFTMIGSPW
jgi:CHAT domain-containing protein